MPARPFTTTCSRTTPPWYGCCRKTGASAVTRISFRRIRPRKTGPQRNRTMSHKLSSPAAVATALVAMMAAPAFAAAAFAADYVQAPGSSLVFASQYDGETFTGSFPGFSTKLSFDPAQLANAKLDVTIPLAGAKTGNGDRDSTLQGAEFFDVAKHAQARYTANKCRALGGNQCAAHGTLSLHGVSKPVTLNFTWTPGAKPVLAGKATVKRLDFGVGTGDWADTKLVPNDIAVSTKVIFTPAK